MTTFCIDGVFPKALPFFPTRLGKAASKHRIVKLATNMAEQLGVPTVADDGRDAIGGHVFRVSGPRHLARHHVGTRLIEILARWGSDVVLGYVKVAPLEVLAHVYKAAPTSCSHPSSSSTAASSSSGVPVKDFAAFSDRVLDILKNLEGENRHLKDEHRRLCRKMEYELTKNKNEHGDGKKDEPPRIVISSSGEGLYHFYLHDVNIPVEEWIAKCGWKYGLSPVIKIMVMPEGISYKSLCNICFKVIRAKMRYDQVGHALLRMRARAKLVTLRPLARRRTRASYCVGQEAMKGGHCLVGPPG